MARRSAQKTEANGEETAAQPGMQALTRGLRVLDFIAEASSPVRFMTLLDGTGFPKGTLHRILQTLIDERYLILDEWNQTYQLGSRPFQLAHRAWDQFDLRGAAAPELERLAGLFNEATAWAVSTATRCCTSISAIRNSRSGCPMVSAHAPPSMRPRLARQWRRICRIPSVTVW